MSGHQFPTVLWVSTGIGCSSGVLNVLCGPRPMSLGSALQNPCKPRDTRVASQLKELTQRSRQSRISEEPYVTSRKVPVKRRKFERKCLR